MGTNHDVSLLPHFSVSCCRPLTPLAPCHRPSQQGGQLLLSGMPAGRCARPIRSIHTWQRATGSRRSPRCPCSDWKAGHKTTCTGLGGTPSPKPSASPAPAKPLVWKPFEPSPETEERIRREGGDTIPCTGLSNIGNTCFINCVLQCVMHSPPAWHYLSSQQHTRSRGGGGVSFDMHYELESLAEQYRTAGKYFAPRSLVRSASRTGNFGGNALAAGEMHDSHEFLVLILDGLLKANLRGSPADENMPKPAVRLTPAAEAALERQTLQHHIFGGTELKAVTCAGCGHRVVRRARQSVLMLEVKAPGEEPPPEPRGISGMASAWVRGAASRTLGYGGGAAAATPVGVDELLEQYNKPEVLEDYKCDGCGKKGCAEKACAPAPASSWISGGAGTSSDAADDDERPLIRSQLWLAEVPPVFVLTLKRYQAAGRYAKISRHVSFEETLDLRAFLAPPDLATAPDDDADADASASSATANGVAATQQEPADEEASEAASPSKAKDSGDDAAPGTSGGSRSGGESAGGAAGAATGVYYLCGVLVHQDMMNSCFFGHYIAFVKRGDKWFCLDDDEVSEVPWGVVAKQKAYMLFYHSGSAARLDAVTAASLPKATPRSLAKALAAAAGGPGPSTAGEETTATGSKLGSLEDDDEDDDDDAVDSGKRGDGASGRAQCSASGCCNGMGVGVSRLDSGDFPALGAKPPPSKRAGKMAELTPKAAASVCGACSAPSSSQAEASSDASSPSLACALPPSMQNMLSGGAAGSSSADVEPPAQLGPSLGALSLDDAPTGGAGPTPEPEPEAASLQPTGAPAQAGATAGAALSPDASEGADEPGALPSPQRTAPPDAFAVPEYTLETLDADNKYFDGEEAYRVVAELKLCTSVNEKGTGMKVTSSELTFRSKVAQYELKLQWPRAVDATRATKQFNKKTRRLTVVAPLLP